MKKDLLIGSAVVIVLLLILWFLSRKKESPKKIEEDIKPIPRPNTSNLTDPPADGIYIEEEIGQDEDGNKLYAVKNYTT